VRFTERDPAAVTGVLTTPDGETPFVYFPATRVVEVQGRRIAINDYGWEIPEGADNNGLTFRSSKTRP
jgi:hypothetical protein